MSAGKKGLLAAFEGLGRALSSDESAALDALAGAVSHELRGGLAAISMWTHALGFEDRDGSTRARALSAIQASVQSQSRLIEDLLDAARSVVATLRLEMVPASLEAAVASAVLATRSSAEARRVRIEVVGPDGEACVRGDSGRLVHALAYVIERALRRAPSGGEVDVVMSREGDTARVTVTAVPEGESVDAGGDGTLGLEAARRIVELHGGDVSVATQGVGYVVTLPVVRTAAPALLGGVRLLVVGGEPGTGEAIAAVLTQLGGRVRAASSTADALVVLDGWLPDALVSALPDDEADDFLRAVRARGQGTVIPAVAVRARPTGETSGFDRELARPIDAAGLALAIDDLVKRK